MKWVRRIIILLLVIAVIFQFCYTRTSIQSISNGLIMLKNNVAELIQNIEHKPDFDKMKLTTVQIKVGKPGGAGIIIKGTKNYLYILTARHIVDRRGKIVIKIRKGLEVGEFVIVKDVDRKNIYQDAKVDLALIKVLKPFENIPYLKLGENTPNVGTKIYTIGHPFCFAYTINEGIVTNYTKRFSCTGRKEEYLQSNAPAMNGSSGGAVVNGDTAVVGISIGIMYIEKTLFPNYSFATKLEDIKRFLKKVEEK